MSGKGRCTATHFSTLFSVISVREDPVTYCSLGGNLCLIISLFN